MKDTIYRFMKFAVAVLHVIVLLPSLVAWLVLILVDAVGAGFTAALIVFVGCMFLGVYPVPWVILWGFSFGLYRLGSVLHKQYFLGRRTGVTDAL